MISQIIFTPFDSVTRSTQKPSNYWSVTADNAFDGIVYFITHKLKPLNEFKTSLYAFVMGV